MLPKDTRRSHDLGTADTDVKAQRHLRSRDKIIPPSILFNALECLRPAGDAESGCLSNPRFGPGSSDSDMFFTVFKEHSDSITWYAIPTLTANHGCSLASSVALYALYTPRSYVDNGVLAIILSAARCRRLSEWLWMCVYSLQHRSWAIHVAYLV
jgi:hypothetical protein